MYEGSAYQLTQLTLTAGRLLLHHVSEVDSTPAHERANQHHTAV